MICASLRVTAPMIVFFSCRVPTNLSANIFSVGLSLRATRAGMLPPEIEEISEKVETVN